VAYGFASVRTAAGREALITDLKKNTLNKYRKHAIGQEIDDLEETCKADFMPIKHILTRC
jgi:hypothetical protein